MEITRDHLEDRQGWRSHARRMQKDNAARLSKFYSKPVLWSRIYFVDRCGEEHWNWSLVDFR